MSLTSSHGVGWGGIGQVDYGATAEELEQHFHGCGAVNRVTILCNKYDGHPKGFAYIEFAEKDSVQMAMALDESLFRGRQLKVGVWAFMEQLYLLGLHFLYKFRYCCCCYLCFDVLICVHVHMSWIIYFLRICVAF